KAPGRSGGKAAGNHRILSASFWLVAPFPSIQYRGTNSRSCRVAIIHNAGELSIELSPGKRAGKRWRGMAIHVNNVHAFAMPGIGGGKTVTFAASSVPCPNNVEPRRVAG